MLRPGDFLNAPAFNRTALDRVSRLSATAAASLFCATYAVCANAQDAAAEPPAVFDIVYTGEFWRLADGGLDEGSTYLDNIDLSLALDLEEMVGWRGASFFGYGFTNNGDSFTEERVGDLQVVSNIDNRRMWRLFELWIEQRFAGDAASVKFGAIDLNTEFDAIDTAGLFLNSSHGIGPDFSQSGQNGPSIFPTTSIAGRIDYENDLLALRVGVFDAVPGDPDNPHKNVFKVGDGQGALLVTEANLTPRDGLRLAAGYWRYTAEFDRLLGVDGRGDPLRRDGNDGAYGFVEAKLLAREGGDDLGLSAFLRAGRADGEINPIDHYIGGGFVYSGLLKTEPPDQLGLAVAAAETSDDFRQASALAGAPIDAREINIEASYRIELAPWLALQPDIQYIINPGVDRSLDNAFVVGLRFELGYQIIGE